MRALTSDRCRSCSVTRRWGPRRCILIRRWNVSRKFIIRRIRGPDQEQGARSSMNRMHSTTILCVRKDGKVAIGGDGQGTAGETAMKTNAHKVGPLRGGEMIAGVAGAAADD